MWDGAQAAYNSPSFAPIRAQAALYPIDDGGAAADADQISIRLRNDPTILAVIGHGTSATTRAAAWHYAQAGIPLLMPIATSPSAPYAPDDAALAHRLKWSFRLPPSDDTQAEAAAYTALKVLHSQACYLVADLSPDAAEYGGPLYDRLQRLLGRILRDSFRLVRRQTSMRELAESIRRQGPDLVLFAGYGTTAHEFLKVLAEAYSKSQQPLPRILMTDGARIRGLATNGFETYLTFPIPPLDACTAKDSPEWAILNGVVAASHYQSYQATGFDAMLLLGKAIEACTGTLNRPCVARWLSSVTDFAGACQVYRFSEGENLHTGYHLFASQPCTTCAQPEDAFVHRMEIPHDALVAFRAELQRQH